MTEEEEYAKERMRPFGLYREAIGGSLFFYLPQEALTINSVRVLFSDTVSGKVYAEPGDWWCVILCNEGKYTAKAMLSAAKDRYADSAIYYFPMASVAADGTFVEHAYGAVQLSGLEDFSRLTPFQICAVRYADDGQVVTDYSIYTPPNGTVQYNGTYLPVVEAYGSNFVRIGVDPDTGATFCCYIEIDGETVSCHVKKGAPPPPDAVQGIIASFPVANVVRVSDDGHDDESEEDSSSSSEDEPKESAFHSDYYQWLGTNFRRRPFSVETSQDGKGYAMYLPPQSITVNSERISIDEVEDDFKVLEQGCWWCVIRCYEEDDEIADGFSGVFHATIDLGTPEKPPKYEDSVFEFPVAEIFEDGRFRSYAYGAVMLDGLKPISSLVPFDLVSVKESINGHTQTKYRVYTPPTGTLQYNGDMLPIKEAVGNWTNLSVGAEGGRFCCYVLDGEAHIDGRYGLYGDPRATLFFPVAEIREDGDESWDDPVIGTISAVVVGVEHPYTDQELPGARASLDNFATMLRAYTSDIAVLYDGDATVDAVKNAFQRAASTAGLAVLYVVGHGGCDQGHNFIDLSDGSLADDDIWNISQTAAGSVFLVFDSCHSGTMYGPPDSAGTSLASPRTMSEALRGIALRSGGQSAVPMLCWSGADDAHVAWSDTYTGGLFTSAIVNSSDPEKTYSAVWRGVTADEDLREMGQQPVETVFTADWTNKRFLSLDGDDSDETD